MTCREMACGDLFAVKAAFVVVLLAVFFGKTLKMNVNAQR